MSNKVVKDIGECLHHCRFTTGCKAMSYRESDKRCHLKSKRGGANGPKPLAGYQSANMDCENNAKYEESSCSKRGDFYGADISSRAVESWKQCEQFCRDTEGCKAITINRHTMTCYMKSQRNGQRLDTHSQDVLLSRNMVCSSN